MTIPRMSVGTLVLRLLVVEEHNAISTETASLPRVNPTGGQHMRYIVFGVCIFAAACAGESPTAPTSSATTSYSSQTGGGTVTTAARGGSELPFKGTYEGLETVLTPPSNHHLDAIGNATHLGRFTVTADWTLAPTGGSGTSRWTAANGDSLFTRFTRNGRFEPPTATFTESHIITGGDGRFANASGIFTVVQTRGLSMPYNNSATIEGTITLHDRGDD
jgi:hypothetical protein